MTSYATVQLADIDLSELKLLKEACHRFGDQDHSRRRFPDRPVPRPSRRPPPAGFPARQALYPYRKALDLYKEVATRVGAAFNHVERIQR